MISDSQYPIQTKKTMDEVGGTLDFLLWCAALLALAFMDGVLVGCLLAAMLGLA